MWEISGKIFVRNQWEITVGNLWQKCEKWLLDNVGNQWEITVGKLWQKCEKMVARQRGKSVGNSQRSVKDDESTVVDVKSNHAELIEDKPMVGVHVERSEKIFVSERMLNQMMMHGCSETIFVSDKDVQFAPKNVKDDESTVVDVKSNHAELIEDKPMVGVHVERSEKIFVSERIFSECGRMVESENLSPQQPPQAHTVNVLLVHGKRTLGVSGGESFWEEGDDFGVDVLRFHTCLTDILGFLEKLEWWFEQDIDDEGEEDEEGKGGSEV
ncbi:hypothetical protein Tco_0857745 [Tanacetum coccineum]|uniref:Uncharacterized protein n=1 Tax=Tanacetum coccineum TaxID=301880 RepID=A0ABQ5B860_9ASTR